MVFIGIDVAAYLASCGYGTVGSSIFLDEFHDSPANQLVVFVGSGRVPDGIQRVPDAIDYPNLDIQVRNTSKAAARATAEEIRIDFDGLTVGDATLYAASSAPEYLGRDTNNRHRFVAEFTAIKER